MSNKSVLLTDRTAFDRCPSFEDGLFDVREGVDIGYALSKASCLAESIAAAACEGVQGGMDASMAYLVEFAAEAIQGLLESVQGAYERKDATA